MKIDYARVSTDEQNLSLQRAALEGAGCNQVFEDHGISGGQARRPGLSEALDALSEGGCAGRLDARPAGPFPKPPG